MFFKLGTPKLLVNEVNQKKVMEQALRESCEAFIAQATTHLIGSVASFMNKVTNPEGEAIFADESSLRDAIFAIVESTQSSFSSRLEEISQLLSSTLQNPSSERLLFSPIEDNVKSAIEQFLRFTDLRLGHKVEIPQSFKEIVALMEDHRLRLEHS
eukprot:TRINITY_DN6819_c0_g1_i3.p1 TRINITY_DN6819_c0_g1~~TRINITY_DN6819_c0_g1_i3.p1  ORF type:complete len:156 (-),score=42.88 TRINITY_DN6819_c0_g1_i3:39-506(-)